MTKIAYCLYCKKDAIECNVAHYEQICVDCVQTVIKQNNYWRTRMKAWEEYDKVKNNFDAREKLKYIKEKGLIKCQS